MGTDRDAWLRDELRLSPVPEHGPEYRRRRQEALATAAAGMQGATAGRSLRYRLGKRPVLLIAAAACLILAASLAVVFLASNPSQTGRHGLSVFGPLSGPGTSAASPTHRKMTLGRIPSPLIGDELAGMTRGVDGSLWAWGIRRPQGHAGEPLLERWDGVRWQTVSAPAGFIDGLAALSSNDIWVVMSNDHGGWLTHWNGIGWQVVRAFAHVSTSMVSNALFALSRTDIWAMDQGNAADEALFDKAPAKGPSTLHWNGRRWMPVAGRSLLAGASNLSLSSMQGPSRGDLWALGAYQNLRPTTAGGKTGSTRGQWASFLLHFDGRRWRRQPLPIRQLSSAPKDSIVIEELAGAANGELWCAGQRWFGPDNSGDLYVPIVLRFAGAHWQVMASSAAASPPADWKDFMPSCIALSSASDVWVGGGTPGQSILWHWDGHSWSAVTLSETKTPDNISTRGVIAIAANDVWVLVSRNVRSSGQVESFFLHFDGSSWQQVPAAS